MYRVFIYKAGSIKAYRFLTPARNGVKLGRNMYELMVKLITLYKVLKKTAAFHETHLKTTLQVVRRARQNVALNVLSLQSYIIP